MTRTPAVADRFYPGDPAVLKELVASLTPPFDHSLKKQAKAVILPHAGYIYSGGTAGKTLSQVKIPETVVILGPNHHGIGAPVSLSNRDWEMPMGTVSIDTDFSTQLQAASEIICVDEAAHMQEHSLEVQLPFLQYINPDIQIVPLVISRISYEACEQVAKALVQVIKNSSYPVLLVASTDMSHYLSRKEAATQDMLAINRMLAFDPKGLFTTVFENQITMCGVLPTVITLLASKQLGARQVELVEYTDSGAVSGDTNQVVGYASLTVY